nr:hypothetical protein [Tanacetum cinerariifolium]
MSLYQRECHGCGQPCDGYYCESCMCPQCGMTLFNGICDNCIYGAGMPIICTACGGIVRGGLCLPCDINDQNSYNCDLNAYSFNNSNYFRQLQDENYFVEVPEKQKQKIEDTMFDLVKICHIKQFLCIHDDVDNLIESALDSKLLLINSINSQHPDKKEQEVKNVEEQLAGRRNRAEKSLQNFRVVHKSSISVNSTSQISSVHAVAQTLSTREPEHLLSMGYEHLIVTPETESDEVTESNAKNLLPIPSKYEVTLEDKIECDMLAKDVCSPVFTTFSNPLFKDNDDLDSSDDESLPDEDICIVLMSNLIL